MDGCETVARSLGMCNVHHLRWSRHRDLDRDNHKSNHVRWLDRDSLSYDAAHDRVKRYRGAASSHLCECGRQAEDWAYDHTDPDPLIDTKGPYSDDWNRYESLCRKCHKTKDAARLGGKYRKREQIVTDTGRVAG